MNNKYKFNFYLFAIVITKWWDMINNANNDLMYI